MVSSRKSAFAHLAFFVAVLQAACAGVVKVHGDGNSVDDVSSHYGHFLGCVVPALLSAAELDGRLTLAVTERALAQVPFLRELRALLPTLDVSLTTDNATYAAARVVGCGALAAYREYVLRVVRPSAVTPPSVLYVRRGHDKRLPAGDNGAYRRVLVNEEAVVAAARHLCDSLGATFRVVVPENLPTARQIEIFSSSAVVIGVHGAGLVNVVFAEQPCVIELPPVQDEHWFPNYFGQALPRKWMTLAADDSNVTETPAPTHLISLNPQSRKAATVSVEATMALLRKCFTNPAPAKLHR